MTRTTNITEMRTGRTHYLTPRPLSSLTARFDKKKPLPSMSSEEEFDPLEGTSGSTPSTNQQHSKGSRTTASSTPTVIEVEETEASQQELIKALMQQATEAREARQVMTQPQIPHERAVDTFLGFLKNELLKIPENVWFNYTMAAMTMAHNFSQATLQQMGHMGHPQMGLMEPPQRMALTEPPHQQAHQPQSWMGPPVMSYSQIQQRQATSTPS